MFTKENNDEEKERKIKEIEEKQDGILEELMNNVFIGFFRLVSLVLIGLCLYRIYIFFNDITWANFGIFMLFSALLYNNDVFTQGLVEELNNNNDNNYD